MDVNHGQNTQQKPNKCTVSISTSLLLTSLSNTAKDEAVVRREACDDKEGAVLLLRGIWHVVAAAAAHSCLPLQHLCLPRL